MARHNTPAEEWHIRRTTANRDIRRNGLTSREIRENRRQRQHGKPDDHFVAAVEAGASWGYFD